jgi:hypothetical protein
MTWLRNTVFAVTGLLPSGEHSELAATSMGYHVALPNEGQSPRVAGMNAMDDF